MRHKIDVLGRICCGKYIKSQFCGICGAKCPGTNCNEMWESRSRIAILVSIAIGRMRAAKTMLSRECSHVSNNCDEEWRDRVAHGFLEKVRIDLEIIVKLIEEHKASFNENLIHYVRDNFHSIYAVQKESDT